MRFAQSKKVTLKLWDCEIQLFLGALKEVREYIQTYCLTRSHMFSTYVDLQTIFISEVILTLVALKSLLGGECVAISRRMQISAKYRLSPL